MEALAVIPIPMLRDVDPVGNYKSGNLLASKIFGDE